MKRAIVILALVLPFMGQAQPLTLDTCVQYAYRNFDYQKQTMAYQQAAELARKNANKGWLPKMVVDGTFTYQNEQITIPLDIPVPGFEAPEAPLNINRLVVNFSQTIYDGSVSSAKKKLEQSKYAIEEEQLEVEKNQLKAKVIGLFMGIQLADESINLLESKKKVLNDRLKVLEGAAKYGGASSVNIKMLKAELLKVEQSMIEARHTRLSLVKSLGQLMGVELPSNQQFVTPNPQVAYENNVDNRPEIKLLNMKVENLELQKGMMTTTRYPKISAFGTLGAGSPGYDIFNDEIAFMGMVGLKLQWNIFDWNYARNEKQILSINQDIAIQQQNRARTQFLVELQKQQLEIEKQKQLIAQDEQLVKLRSEVSKIKAAELDQGSITTTDYLFELNAEEEARLNQKMHELKLILAKLNYLNIQGK